MKYLIPLLLLFACAEPEIVEKIVREPEYITQTVTSTDTLIIEREVIIRDTITVYVIDTVYVERKATITYHPKYEPFVTRFFSKYDGDMVIMDIHIDDIPIDIANSGARYSPNVNAVKNGVLIIWIATPCPEGTIYRELLHSLYAVPFFNEWYAWDPDANDYIMAKNWDRCLETMSDEERTKYLKVYFLE